MNDVFTLMLSAMADKTGSGVSIAVIDSGVHASHPHVNGVAGGVGIDPSGNEHDDFVDRLGHGTAVAAAIKEKAPDSELYAVKVFDEELSTNAKVLVRAIDWASSRGVRLINLSLGTAKAEREEMLQSAVDRAGERGSFVVAASSHDGQRWLPGSLRGALGVMLDWDCDRDEVRITTDADGGATFHASGRGWYVVGGPDVAALQFRKTPSIPMTGSIRVARRAKSKEMHRVATSPGQVWRPEHVTILMF